VKQASWHPLLARRSSWLGDGPIAAEPLGARPQLSVSIAASRAPVLLAATMTLVAFSTIALVASFVWHARQPVILSLIAIPLAVATLVFYTRMVRTGGSDDAWAPVVAPTGSLNPQALSELTSVVAASQPPSISIVSSQPPPAPARPRTDARALRSRRKQAAGLFSQGLGVAETARRLGVARGTVSNWHGLWKHGGAAALASSPPPRLTAARLAPIRETLDRGPQASGYPTDAWTLAQVTEVIERLTGVRYEPNRVRRILRDRMGWEAHRLEP
jgi:transposase